MALGDLNYKGILLGCDNWGTIIDERTPYKNKDGIEMKAYLIIPSPDLIEAYPHILKKVGALNVPTPRGRGLWVEYPTYWIVDRNPSRKNAIARVLCSFDGRDTVHTKRDSYLAEENKLLQQEVEREKLANIQLMQDYKDALKELAEVIGKWSEISKSLKGEKYEGPEGEEPA